MLPDTRERINCRDDYRAFALTDKICQSPGAKERVGNADQQGQPNARRVLGRLA